MNQSLFAGIAIDQADLCLLILKSQLWSVVTEIIRNKDISQKETAKLLGVSQPRISDMMKGKLDKFSMDFFINTLVRLGYKLDIDFTPDNVQAPMAIYVKKAAL